MDKIAIIAFPRDIAAAEKIQDKIQDIQDNTDGRILLYSKDVFRQAFSEYDSIIAIMAAGIVVRNIAPLLKDKWTDPAVVVVDSGLNFAIPVLGGHHGGNELARKLSCTGVQAVITTATEVKGKESVEKVAKVLGCRIVNRESTKKVNAALLEKDVDIILLKGPEIVLVDDEVCVLKKTGLVVGIGANSGVRGDEVKCAVRSALSEIEADIEDVNFFASAMIKQNESGIIEAAAEFGKELRFVPHEIINSIKTPSPSKANALGLNGVCEPAAIAVSQNKKLILKKRIYGNVTIAIAR